MTSSMFLRLSGRASASRSELAVDTNWAKKSRMVSQRAVKVGREESGPRCCRNTCTHTLYIPYRTVPVYIRERTETPKLGPNGTVVRTAHWDQGKEDLERVKVKREIP